MAGFGCADYAGQCVLIASVHKTHITTAVRVRGIGACSMASRTKVSMGWWEGSTGAESKRVLTDSFNMVKVIVISVIKVQ